MMSARHTYNFNTIEKTKTNQRQSKLGLPFFNLRESARHAHKSGTIQKISCTRHAHNSGQFRIFPVPGTHTIPKQFIPKTSKKKSTKIFSGFLSVNFVFDSRIHLHRVRRMCRVFCVRRRRRYPQARLLPLILR